MFQRLVHEWGEERVREDGDESPVLEPHQIAYVVYKRIFHAIMILIDQQGKNQALFPLL